MTMRGLLSLQVSALALTFADMAGAQEIDWKKVDAALGKNGAVQGSVHRYGLPRSDLRDTVDGVAIKPALALGGWVAFAPARGGAMVMGDVVLTETEIKPAVHFWANDDAVKLAKGLRAALEKTAITKS